MSVCQQETGAEAISVYAEALIGVLKERQAGGHVGIRL